jgi:hypothetical protein
MLQGWTSNGVLVGSFASGQNVDCIDREKRMNKLRGLLIGLMLLGISDPALADSLNFESPIVDTATQLGDWATTGNVNAVQTVILPPEPYLVHTVSPIEGEWQAQLGSDGVVIDSLEQFFGVTPGTWETPNFARGSGMYRDFVLDAGQTVHFNWQFIAGDFMPYDDAAVFLINSAGTLLSSVSLVGGDPDPNSPPDDGSSGWQELIFPSLGPIAAGTYRLGLAVMDNEPFQEHYCDPANPSDPACVGFNPSYLLVDNFRIVTTDEIPNPEPTPVPEPSTLFLLTGGFGAVIAARARRAR